MQQQSGSQPVAVVTGASTGFGRLTAEALAADGYRVFAGIRGTGGRNASTVAELAKLGIEAVELDVTDDASVDAAAQNIFSKSDRIDIVVNNAGSAYFGLVEAFTPDRVREQYDVNVFGPLRVNRAFLPKMREQRRGLIVYISSVVGRFTTPYIGVYSSSKWAVEALAETTAYEVRAFGIDVAIVQPGAYQTNIGNRMVIPDDANRTASYGETAERFQAGMEALFTTASDRPAEVAEAIVRLARRAPGQRPLRTVVGGNEAAVAINAMVAPVSRQIMEGSTFGDFTPEVLVDESLTPA